MAATRRLLTTSRWHTVSHFLKSESVLFGVDFDCVAVCEFACQQFHGQWVF
jgi:hypothetical protein